MNDRSITSESGFNGFCINIWGRNVVRNKKGRHYFKLRMDFSVAMN